MTFALRNLDRPFLIAEIGNNHGGSPALATTLVQQAVSAGFDAVKFQVRDPVLATPAHMRDAIRQGPEGPLSYLEYRKRVELNRSFYASLRGLIGSSGRWLASPWDSDSLAFLEGTDCDGLKIPSVYSGQKEFVEQVQVSGKPVIVSLGGASSQQAIERCRTLYLPETAVLHCTSLYPPRRGQLNLNFITRLRRLFPERTVGFSCHIPNESAVCAAVAAGAQIVEVHVTLSRSGLGSDHPISFEAHELESLVQSVRSVSEMMGSKDFQPSEEELEKLNQLNALAGVNGPFLSELKS